MNEEREKMLEKLSGNIMNLERLNSSCSRPLSATLTSARTRKTRTSGGCRSTSANTSPLCRSSSGRIFRSVLARGRGGGSWDEGGGAVWRYVRVWKPAPTRRSVWGGRWATRWAATRAHPFSRKGSTLLSNASFSYYRIASWRSRTFGGTYRGEQTQSREALWN